MVNYNEHEALARVLHTLSGDELFLFPIDWGSAREADILEGYLSAEGVYVIRYDIQVPGYGHKQGFRKVRNDPLKVSTDLSQGISRINDPNGYLIREIEPVSFDQQRPIVPFEDYVRYTGYGLLGGIEFSGRIRPLINGSKIYPTAVRCNLSLNLPEGFAPDIITHTQPLIYPSYLVIRPKITPLTTRQKVLM